MYPWQKSALGGLRVLQVGHGQGRELGPPTQESVGQLGHLRCQHLQLVRVDICSALECELAERNDIDYGEELAPPAWVSFCRSPQSMLQSTGVQIQLPEITGVSTCLSAF